MRPKDKRLLRQVQGMMRGLRLAQEQANTPFGSSDLDALQAWLYVPVSWIAASALLNGYEGMPSAYQGDDHYRQVLEDEAFRRVAKVAEQRLGHAMTSDQRMSVHSGAHWMNKALDERWRRLAWYERAGLGAVQEAMCDAEQYLFRHQDEIPYTARLAMTYLRHCGESID